MLSRRDLIRTLSIGATLPLIVSSRPSLVHAAGPRTRLHAMIVGINDYNGRIGRRLANGSMAYHAIKRLGGCLNDSNGIEAAIRPHASSVRALRDRDVTRRNFFSAWQATLAAAKPGDIILLTYAGHGGQEPERIKGNEADGLDETLILAGFDAAQDQVSAERIIDDEMATLFEAARQKQVTVIYVIDACHSGTPTRAVDPRAAAGLTYRSEGRYDFASRALTPATTATAAPPPEELPNLIVLTASQDDEIVPELTIEGRKHGALSYAVARGLAGAADLNQDGIITGAELTQYVLHCIRTISDASQHPQVRWPTPDARMGVAPSAPVLVLPQAAGAKRPRQIAAAAKSTTIRLAALGLDAAAQTRSFARLTDAEPAGRDGERDLVWHAATGDVFNDFGNRIAEGVKADALQYVIDRKIALDAIAAMSADRGLALSLRLPGEENLAAPSLASDRTHTAGTQLKFQISGITQRYFVLFNLTGSGQIQELDKGGDGKVGRDLSAQGQAGRNVLTVAGQTRTYQDDLLVQAPFGADHVVAVAADSPLNQLAPAVRSHDGKFAARPVLEALRREAELNRITVGYQGIYSVAR